MRRTICGLSSILMGVFAFADEPTEQTIQEWQESNDIVIAESALTQLAGEIDSVATHVNQSSAYDASDAELAVEEGLTRYLDNNLNQTVSPTLLGLTMEELSPGGMAAMYPTKYPVLTISASFELIGVVINGETESFEPTKVKKLLLGIGDYSIETRGGEDDDCEYRIVAERGQHYAKSCPEESS